jgi:DNA sulfur modification protein DndB
MSDTNSTLSSATEQLNQVLSSLLAQYHRKKCYIGLRFEQGKRDMIQINVPADQISTLLQEKPSTGNDPDSGKNRPEIKGHAQEVKDYIIKRIQQDKPWILGTLTANVNPEKLEIIDLGRGICLAILDRSVKLEITDGQHRKRAIKELLESPDAEELGIAENNIPITLVLEADFRQCQTDFRDMAQSKGLDKSLLLSFGEYEGQIGITKHLVEKVGIFQNKTEKIKSSASSKKKLIYTNNFIARAVSCTFTNDPSNQLENFDTQKSAEILANALNQFFGDCQHTQHLHHHPPEDLSYEEIDRFKAQVILGRSVGLEILGRLLNSCYDSSMQEFQPDKIKQLSQLDWSRNGVLWQGNIISSQNEEKKLSTGATAVRAAIEMVKYELGWINYPDSHTNTLDF